MAKDTWRHLFDLLLDEDLDDLASMNVKAEIDAAIQARKKEDPNQLIFCFGCVVADAIHDEGLVGQRLGDVKKGPYTCTGYISDYAECSHYEQGEPLYRTSLADIIGTAEGNPHTGYEALDGLTGENRIRLTADEVGEYQGLAKEISCGYEEHQMSCDVCGESEDSIQRDDDRRMGYDPDM